MDGLLLTGATHIPTALENAYNARFGEKNYKGLKFF